MSSINAKKPSVFDRLFDEFEIKRKKNMDRLLHNKEDREHYESFRSSLSPRPQTTPSKLSRKAQQELTARLTSKKRESIERVDRARTQQRIDEMREVRERPSISPKTRKMAANFEVKDPFARLEMHNQTR